jgi:hypothetical protein
MEGCNQSIRQGWDKQLGNRWFSTPNPFHGFVPLLSEDLGGHGLQTSPRHCHSDKHSRIIE